MEPISTRELILRSALRLFADQGYSAVSMRDIAADVGIRASSIYHHFTGKQQLLDALLGEAEAVKEEMKRNFTRALAKTEAVEREAFIRVGVASVTEYLGNPSVAPLLRVLESERFRDARANAAWRGLIVDAPMEHEESVFRALMDRGEIAPGDARALAGEYQAMVVLAYLTENTERLQAWLERFYQRVFINR